MMNRYRTSKFLVLAAALILSGCAKPTPPPAPPPQFDPAQFDGRRALEEAGNIVQLGSRDAGTTGSLKAARHLKERLVAVGVQADMDEFKDDTPRGTITMRNVIGRLPGEGKGLIILCSHYDTKSGITNFDGANDSASSSAALLEMASVMARGPVVPPTIEFAFFDGEECMNHYGPSDGLHGSRHMAGQLIQRRETDNVKAVILLDMIGDSDLSVTIPRNSSASLAAATFAAAEEEGARSKFSLFPFEIGDDHDPFYQAGMPAIDIIDFQFGSAPGRNDYWHTSQDTMDKISAKSLETVGRVTVRVVNKLISAEAAPSKSALP